MVRYSFPGKVVLVTGSSRGMGAAFLEEFAAAGAACVVNYFADEAGQNERDARQTAERQVRLQLHQDLHNSVYTFHNVQREREKSLTHSAQLLADLPILKALMTTSHAATIQDSSQDLWNLAGTDLFVLADRSGKIVALHSKAADFDRGAAQEAFTDSMAQSAPSRWWFFDKHLFQVSLQPIYVGPVSENQVVGYLAMDADQPHPGGVAVR